MAVVGVRSTGVDGREQGPTARRTRALQHIVQGTRLKGREACSYCVTGRRVEPVRVADIAHLARLAELLVVRSHFSLFPFKSESPAIVWGLHRKAGFSVHVALPV